MTASVQASCQTESVYSAHAQLLKFSLRMTVLRLYTNLRHALAAILEICVGGLLVNLGDLLGVPAVVPGPRQCVLV